MEPFGVAPAPFSGEELPGRDLFSSGPPPEPEDGLDGSDAVLALPVGAEPFLPLSFLLLSFLDFVGCATEVAVTCVPCEVVVVAPAGPASTTPLAVRAKPSAPAEVILAMRWFMSGFSIPRGVQDTARNVATFSISPRITNTGQAMKCAQPLIR